MQDLLYSHDRPVLVCRALRDYSACLMQRMLLLLEHAFFPAVICLGSQDSLQAAACTAGSQRKRGSHQGAADCQAAGGIL